MVDSNRPCATARPPARLRFDRDENAMTILVLGLIIFFAIHGFTMARGARAALIAQVGEGRYKGLYAAASAVGLILMIIGYGTYRDAGRIAIWTPPEFLRHITFLLMLIAFILFAASYGQSHIRAVVRHPMLTAVKTWSLAHLLVRGDAGSILLFGSFLVWAVLARVSIKRREERSPAITPAWTYDIATLVIGIVGYLAFLFGLHRWLIGVPLLPG
jgi:uncharacterized membrane protein